MHGFGFVFSDIIKACRELKSPVVLLGTVSAPCDAVVWKFPYS
jgi:hypothetical protein